MTDPTEPTCPYCDAGALAVAHFQGVASERARMQARIEVLEAENSRMRGALEQLDAPCSCHPAFSGRGLQDPHCEAGDHGDIAREGLGKPPVCQFNLRIAALKGEGE